MKIVLAPMEGVVDAKMRHIYSKIGGFDQFVTEFVRVTTQKLPHHVFYKHCPELLTGGRTLTGVPVYVQLLGSDPEMMAENALVAAALGAPGIDVNFGCPAKTVNRRDGGAVLLKNPERVEAVLSAIRKHLPAHIPLTAKVRLGFEHKDFACDIARAVEAGGAAHLTIHARTKLEGYSPPAHWEFIGLMRQAIKLPILANGDIWTLEDYQRCVEVTGCRDVAIGRPILSRPDLALTLKDPSRRPWTWEEILDHAILPFWEMESESRYLVLRMKQWLRFLTRTYPEAQELFEKIKRLNDSQEIRSEIQPQIA